MTQITKTAKLIESRDELTDKLHSWLAELLHEPGESRRTVRDGL